MARIQFIPPQRVRRRFKWLPVVVVILATGVAMVAHRYGWMG